MNICLLATLLNVISPIPKGMFAGETRDAKMRWDKVQRLVKSGQLEQAEAETKALLPHLSKPQEGYNFLGLIYELLKKPKEAEEAYLKAFRIEPGSIQTRSNLGTLYAAQDHFDLAFHYLNPIRNFVHDNPDACFALIRGAMVLQRREIAQEVIKSLNPQAIQDGNLSLSLASLLQEYEFYGESVTYFQRAAELSPEDYRSYYGLGICYFQMRDYEQAKARTRTALQLNPRLAQGLTLLGKIALEEGDLVEARKWLAESLSQNGANDHALFLLATLHIKDTNYLEARRRLERSIAINPNIPEYYFSLITTYHEVHDYRGAVQLARQTLSRFPENPDALFNVALELTFLNEFQQAEAYFRKTIEAFKTYPGKKYPQTLIAAKYRLAHQLLRGASYDEAGRFLKEVIEMDPNYVEAYLDLARLNIRRREYQDACRLLERAITLNPRNEGAHYLLAKALSLAGDKEQAEREYRKFSELRKE